MCGDKANFAIIFFNCNLYIYTHIFIYKIDVLTYLQTSKTVEMSKKKLAGLFFLPQFHSKIMPCDCWKWKSNTLEFLIGKRNCPLTPGHHKNVH